MAPKNPDDKSDNMAAIELLTGVSPGSLPRPDREVPVGNPNKEVPSNPAPSMSSSPNGTGYGGSDSSSNTATLEMITGVAPGSLGNSNGSNGAASHDDAVVLAETLGIPLDATGIPSKGSPNATQLGATGPAALMSLPDVLAIVNSGTIDNADGSISLPSGNDLSWATELPSESVSIRTTRITGAGLPEMEYWQRNEHVDSPLFGVGGKSYDQVTYSDGREFYKINGSADVDTLSISPDGVVTLVPKDPSRSTVSFSILDDEVGPTGLDGSTFSLPTDTLSVNLANWMLAVGSDGAFATVHTAGIDVAKGTTWLDRLAYRRFGGAIDKGLNFTGPFGKGAGVTGALTLPLAIYADMAGSSQDSFWRATAREVPSVALGTMVGGVASAATAGALAGSVVPVVGTAAGLLVGATLGTIVAWKMSEGMDQVLPEFASGGLVSGPGGPTSDSVLAKLSNGEYVVNAKAVRQFGGLLEAINSGDLSGVLSTFFPQTGSGEFADIPSIDIDALSSDGAAAGLSGGLSGVLSGLDSGGLVGGITGGIQGAASAAGGQVGSTIGAAIGTAVGGPVGSAIGGVLGSVAGSEVLGTAAEFITKPIEYAAETAKEVIGTGFGLVDLAEGPGAHTARGDIYNFNGMDPKSAAVAVERVRRRRVLAQQRGGGLGR